MGLMFPPPFGARCVLIGIATLVLICHPTVTITWAHEHETRPAPPLSFESINTPLSLTIVWYDNYDLLPRSIDRMRREVDRLFAEVGVTVRWKDGKQIFAADVIADSLSVNVVLLPSDPKDWGLGNGVMGLATHRPGMKGSVYLFQPGIFRTLGMRAKDGVVKSPLAMVELARAIGRVVTHEVIHFVAPRYPHTESGLMSRSLSRSFLTRRGIHIDGVSSMVLRAELLIQTNRVLAANRDRERDLVAATDGR